MFDEWDALTEAHAVLEDAMRAVVETDLQAPSAASGWSIEELAQHIVGGAVRYRLFFERADESVIAPTRGADHLHGDPLAAAVATSAALESVIRSCELDAEYRFVTGDRLGHDLLALRVFEAALHGWDLNSSIDRETPLSEPLCEWMLERLYVLDPAKPFNVYGDAVETSATDARSRLLAATGRS